MHPADLFQYFPTKQGTLGRADAIKTILAGLGTRVVTLDKVHPRGRNILVRVGSPSKTAPILEAHYDIVNGDSENCQDNTASVCHLLALAHNPKFNGFLAFCDGEELVDFDIAGARWLNDLIVEGLDEVANPGWTERRDATFFDCIDRTVLCLELTAIGDMIWADHSCAKEFGVENFRRCPFNDAVILRAHGSTAAQISITPTEMYSQHYPDTWHACHQLDDAFAAANRQDMAKFQEWILNQPWTR